MEKKSKNKNDKSIKLEQEILSHLRGNSQKMARSLAVVLEKKFHMDTIDEIMVTASRQDILDIIAKEFEFNKKCNLKNRGDETLTPRDYDYIRRKIDAINLLFARNVSLQVAYRETDLYAKHEIICPVCGRKMAFKETAKFNIYFCPNSSCDTLVSCHPYSALPAGVAATRRVRDLRKSLHELTAQVFKGPRRKLYEFLAEMVGRQFNEFEGHIGSMNEAECSKMISMFLFLKERGAYLEFLRKTSLKEYLLEENFLSTATHKELQAYYLLVKTGFSVERMSKALGIAGKALCTFLAQLISKGLLLSGWKGDIPAEIASAAMERESLSQKLLSMDEAQQRNIVCF